MESTSRGGRGVAMRRKVLGNEYVDASLNAADDFTKPLQDYLNENCWGATWLRPGLDLKSRSLITLTALAAGSKWSEFKTHTRGALRNGWTADELREAFLHMGVYLGVPTAVEAFRVAQQIVAEAQSG